jgi:hypothetical protein
MIWFELRLLTRHGSTARCKRRVKEPGLGGEGINESPLSQRGLAREGAPRHFACTKYWFWYRNYSANLVTNFH